MSHVFRRPFDYVRRRVFPAALLTGSAVALSASGDGVATGSATLSVAKDLSATGSGAATGSASLQVAVSLTASATGAATGSADLTIAGQVDLAAVGTGAATGSATLSIARSLEASNTGVATGSASLDVTQAAFGWSHEISTLRRRLLGRRFQHFDPYRSGVEQRQRRLLVLLDTADLEATGTGVATGSANLVINRGMVANGTGIATGSASPSLTVGLQAAGSGVATGAAALSTSVNYVATGTGVATGTAALSRTLALTATGSGAATGSASLDVSGAGGVPLTAIGSGAASGSAALSVLRSLEANGEGVATGEADLWREVGLEAEGSGVAVGSASMQIALGLTAIGTGESTGFADLTVPGDLNPWRITLRYLGPRHRVRWTQPRELAPGSDLLFKVAVIDALTEQPITAGLVLEGRISLTPGGPSVGTLDVALTYQPAARAWTGVIDRAVLSTELPQYIGRRLYVIVEDPTRFRWSRALTVLADGTLSPPRSPDPEPDLDVLYAECELLWKLRIRDEATLEVLTSGVAPMTRLAESAGGVALGVSSTPATWSPSADAWVAVVPRAVVAAASLGESTVFGVVDDGANLRGSRQLDVIREGEC